MKNIEHCVSLAQTSYLVLSKMTAVTQIISSLLLMLNSVSAGKLLVSIQSVETLKSVMFRELPGLGGRWLLALPDQPLHQPSPRRRGAPGLPSPAQPSSGPSSGVRSQPSLGRPLLPPLVRRRHLEPDIPRLLHTRPQVHQHQAGWEGVYQTEYFLVHPRRNGSVLQN